MSSGFKRHLAAFSVAVAAVGGAGVGAGIYALTSSNGSSTAPIAAQSAAPVAKDSSLSVAQIYAKDAKSVVEIEVTTSAGQQSVPFGGSGGEQQAQGSGFVYDTSGHIVTNQHVVDGADSVTVKFADGSTYKATVVGSDPSTDVAVIKVDAPSSELHPLTLADSGKVAVGDGVVAIGSPFGLENTVTTGIVSGVDREIQAPDNSPIENAIQTDAAINHGNSGGVLLDLQGDVIGITSQIESDSGGSDGIGFAVPSNTVKSVAAQILANGSVKHALLGVEAVTLPANVAQSLGVPAGVAIQSVQSGSAADDAGLHAATGKTTVAGQQYPTGGDVITEVDGTRVTTSEQLRGIIAGHEPGDKVQLTVVRAGDTRTVTVTLGSRSSSS
jgi:putative serine protease PepD